MNAATGLTGPAMAAQQDTRLRGRWLVLVRVGWVLVVVCTLALFVGGLPTYDALLQRPCVGAGTCNLNGALIAATLRALQSTGLSPSGYAAYTIALTLVITLLWSAVGLVIFWRRSDDWVALLAALTLVLYNPGQQDQALSALAYVHPAWTVPAEIVTLLGEAPIVFFLLLFPDGRFAPRWIGWFLPVALAQTTCLILLPPDVLNATPWLLALNGLLFIALLLVVVFSQIYRYRRVSNAVQRQQIKWVVFGIILTAVLLVALSLITLVPGLYRPGSLLELVLNTLYPLAALPLPICIGIAILRFRLWDIATIINKALVYGSLTGLLAAMYTGLIVGLESLADAFGGRASQQPVVLVISTLMIVALFNPLRQRIQRVIDRRFYRAKYDAARTLERFAATLRSDIDLAALREHLLSVVEETMQPAYVSLWLAEKPATNRAPEIPR